MRRVNVRLVVILAIITVVGSAGLFGVHRYQLHRHADYFIKQAEAREAEWKSQQDSGEEADPELIEQAISFRKRYTGLYPNDTEARAELGMMYFEAGAVDQAFFTFEKVLRNDPTRAEIRRKVISAAMAMRRWPDARDHLKYLMEEYANDPKLHYQLGSCQLQQGEYEEAIASFEKAIEYGSKGDDAYYEAYRQLGRLCIDNLNDENRGAKFIDRLVQDNPNDSTAHAVATRFYHYCADNLPSLSTEEKKDRLTKARDEGKKAMELSLAGLLGGWKWEPDGTSQADSKAEGESSEEAIPEAFKEPSAEQKEKLKAASSEDKAKLQDALTATASAADKVEDSALARFCAKLLVDLSPNRPEGYHTLASTAHRLGNREEALEWLRKGMVPTDESTDLLWPLSQYYIEEEKFAEAEDTLERISVRNMDERNVSRRIRTAAALKLAEAELEAAKGNWRTALQMFETNREKVADNPQLVKQTDAWIAKCKRELGQHQQVVDVIRKAMSDSVQDRVVYAAALARAERIDDAIKEWNAILKSGKAPEGALLQISQLLIRRNLRQPKSRRNWNEVFRVLDKAEEADSDPSRIALLRAEAYRGKGETDEAREVLRTAVATFPDEFVLRDYQIRIEIGEENWPEVEKLLKETKSTTEDSVNRRLLEGLYLVARYGKESVDRLRKLEQKADAFSGEDNAKLMFGLAALAQRVGDFKYARSLMEQLVRNDPRNRRAQLNLFQVASAMGDAAGMERRLEELLQIEGRSAVWHFGNAMLLQMKYQQAEDKAANENILRDALKHLTEARVQEPKSAQTMFMTAVVYEQLGDRERAIEFYSKAQELGDNRPELIKRLVVLLFQEQRFEKADKIISLLDESTIKESKDLTRIWAEIKLLRKEYEKALELAEASAKQSDDYRDHVWLGRVYAAMAERAHRNGNNVEMTDRAAQAEKSLRKALEMNSTDPQAWIAMVQLLSVTGDRRKALELIEQAKTKIDPSKLSTALSRMYDVAGDFAAARGQLTEELKANPDDPVVLRRATEFFIRKKRSNESAELLKRMIALKETPADDKAWARRQLALILLGRGGYQNYLEAVSLMDENLKLDPSSLYDQRIKARILAARATRAQRKEAIAMIENLLKGDQSGTSEDRFVLARLYLAEGNWSKARDQMQQLLATAGDNPKYLETFIRDLIKRGEGREAGIWVDQLERIAPKAFATADLRVQVLAEQGKIEEAIKVLNTYLQAEDTLPLDKKARLLPVAETLETIGRRLETYNRRDAAAPFNRAAEGVFRRYVSENPKEELRLGMFLARQGRLDDALEVLENAWRRTNSRTVGVAAIAMITGTGANDAQLKRIEKVLDDALASQDDSVSLLLAKAELCIFQGRDRDAENIYRDVIKKNANNVVALNNLAVFLANRKTELDEALKLINKCIELAGPVSALLDSRATVYLAQGNWEAAIEDLEEAISDTPTPARYFHLAEAQYGFQDITAAMKALQEAHNMGLSEKDLRKAELPRYAELKKALSRAPASR